MTRILKEKVISWLKKKKGESNFLAENGYYKDTDITRASNRMTVIVVLVQNSIVSVMARKIISIIVLLVLLARLEK